MLSGIVHFEYTSKRRFTAASPLSAAEPPSRNVQETTYFISSSSKYGSEPMDSCGTARHRTTHSVLRVLASRPNGADLMRPPLDGSVAGCAAVIFHVLSPRFCQVAEPLPAHLPLSSAAPQRYPREVFNGTARTQGTARTPRNGMQQAARIAGVVGPPSFRGWGRTGRAFPQKWELAHSRYRTQALKASWPTLERCGQSRSRSASPCSQRSHLKRSP